MKQVKRIRELPPYLFVDISRIIAKKKAAGEEVISFAIGDPDRPTPESILDCLCNNARRPENHSYPETEGLLKLRQAIADWYQLRFGVKLDADSEVLPLIGSKEGIGHMSFCYIDKGDIALVPDPGYPVYGISTMLAGGEPFYMPLVSKYNYLPDFTSIPEDILNNSKLMWLNYPNNPTAAVANKEFFERAVVFAKKHDIAICHDNPYSEIAYDGYKPVSYLEAKGSKETGVEFHSFSKTYNMAGWRIGMVVGNAAMIDGLRKIKSNLDSGIPQAIQLAAIEALRGSQDNINIQREIYQRRRDMVLKALDIMGLTAVKPKASLYIWAQVPAGFTSSGFATELLDKTGVAVTPGTGYGKQGEGYIRLSLTINDKLMEKGLEKLTKWSGKV